jgi:hypothetical protein
MLAVSRATHAGPAILILDSERGMTRSAGFIPQGRMDEPTPKWKNCSGALLFRVSKPR